MKSRNLIVVFVISFFLLSVVMVQITSANEHDALIQSAKKEYDALKNSLVKKYEDGDKRAEEQDDEYRRKHNMAGTIRHQVQNWKWTATDGYNAMFNFLKSEDFDKAAIIDGDYYFHEALGMPIKYKIKDIWQDEIGPAYSAVQGICGTDDINECDCVILKKAFPYFRDFSNKIEKQVAGFYQSLDQSKLKYYDSYYKETRSFTFTWPKNIDRRLNFFEGEHYDQEFQSWKISGCHLKSPSLLNLGIRSNEDRLHGVFVSLYLLYFAWVASLVVGIIFLVLTKKGKTKGVLIGFQFLMGASAVGLPLSGVLYNVLSALLNVEESVFFMMAVFVCPLGFLVGAVGTIVINIRSKQVKQSS